MSDIEWRNEYRKLLIDESENEHIITELILKHMPKSLFRYMRFDEYWKKNIFEGQIFISSANRLNDPFDCMYSIDMDDYVYYRKEIDKISDEEMNFKSIQDLLNNRIIKRLMRYMLHFKNHTRVACFSENLYSVLMWSHYADGHSGFCIEYDFNSIDELKELISPVVYSNDRYDLSEALANYNHQKMLYNCFFFKSLEWAYEKEWRIVIPEGMFENNKFYFNGKNGIKGIYLGFCSNNKYSKESVEIIKWAKQNGIKVYAMLASSKDYSLFPMPLVK